MPRWGEEEGRKQEGDIPCSGKVGKNKCEWGYTRSGELHEHVIREEREGVGDTEVHKKGVSVLVIWT